MSDWPILSWTHLAAIIFAYNEGYGKAYDRRVFPNPFSIEGSQAAAYDCGITDGKDQRDRHDAFVSDKAQLSRTVQPQLDTWIRNHNLVVTSDHYSLLLELVASVYAGDVLKLPTISTERVSHMTKRKTEDIVERDNMVVTGFVLTDSNGKRGIVESDVVRWLSQDQFYGLMHPSPSSVLQERVNNRYTERNFGEDDDQR